MVQINVLTICLASISVLNSVSCKVENNLSSEITTSVEFTAANDVDQFLSKNPDPQLLENVSKISDTKNQMIYRFGYRVNGILNISINHFIENENFQIFCC